MVPVLGMLCNYMQKFIEKDPKMLIRSFELNLVLHEFHENLINKPILEVNLTLSLH